MEKRAAEETRRLAKEEVRRQTKIAREQANEEAQNAKKLMDRKQG